MKSMNFEVVDSEYPDLPPYISWLGSLTPPRINKDNAFELVHEKIELAFKYIEETSIIPDFGGYQVCPFCLIYGAHAPNHNNHDGCLDCPVFAVTGRKDCYDTGYYEYEDALDNKDKPKAIFALHEMSQILESIKEKLNES